MSHAAWSLPESLINPCCLILVPFSWLVLDFCLYQRSGVDGRWWIGKQLIQKSTKITHQQSESPTTCLLPHHASLFIKKVILKYIEGQRLCWKLRNGVVWLMQHRLSRDWNDDEGRMRLPLVLDQNANRAAPDQQQVSKQFRNGALVPSSYMQISSCMLYFSLISCRCL